jgi:hypothetical protein
MRNATVPGGSRCITLYLLMLTEGHGKDNFKVVPSMVLRVSFITTASCTVEVIRREDLGVCSAYILRFTDGDAYCFCIIHTILNLFELMFPRVAEDTMPFAYF